MSYDNDVGRGINAQAVLSNPEFRLAIADIKTALQDAIGLTAANQKEQREFLYQCICTLPFVERALMSRMNTGVVDARSLLSRDENELGI